MQRKESNIAQFTFEELSEVFNGLVLNPELFDCGEINLLKIFQHAVASKMVGTHSPVTITFDKPAYYQNGISMYRKLKRKELYADGKKIAKRIVEKKFLLYSGSNCLLDDKGELVSANTRNILEEIGRENCLYIYREYKGKSDPTGQDFSYSQLNYYAENRTLDSAEKNFFSQVNETYKRVLASEEIPQEYGPYFARQLQIFCNNFRFWNLVLRKCKPEKLYLTMHYHSEGILAAAKLLGIPSYEFQHGLISSNDYYYVYSNQFKSVVDRALFADKIMLFGTYWGKILDGGCEYPPSKRCIIGSYQYRPDFNQDSLDRFEEKYALKDKKVILVATQTSISDYYADYIAEVAPKLALNHPEYCILIKPHPNQRDMHLLEACDTFSNVVICAKTDDLMLALRLSDIQISLYSTTFYDAIGTGTINLSLYNHEKFRKYAELMIAEKIALPLNHDDDPVEIAEKGRLEGDGLSRDEVYAEFDSNFWKY